MMMNQDQTIQKADTLARDVLMLARNTLLVNLRFLDAALSQFTLEPRSGNTFATDGQTVYYDALHVLRSYRAEHAGPARDYLHLVLHCVLRHLYIHKNVEPNLWDLACDIAVERAISGFGLTAVSVEKEQSQQKAVAEMQQEIGMLTAEKIYRYLQAKQLRPDQMEELRELFLADDHRLWHAPDGGEVRRQSLEESENFWVEVSQRMQVDMETFARRQGDKAEAMMQNLREVNRETYDYAGFLQRFAARGEVMKTDPEEFDYIFYTYGMQLYEKMPLIEPVEFKETKQVRDFVLAVDLSGLISLAQAQQFLRKTYEVLKATESFSLKVNLHILTCGKGEPDYVRINGAEDFEEYLNSLKIREKEVTDFRPAFLQMDELVHKRAFRNLKGLIYFTDGFGAFPPKKPDFDAVFVLVNDNYSNPDVPPWAIRLVLQKEELSDGQQE